MRKIIYTLLTLVLVTSCKENKQETIDYVIVSGKIENAAEASLKVNKNYKPVVEITLNTDGTFTDTLRLRTGTYSIQAGKNFIPVYIKEGRNININFNASDFKNSLTITGIGAPETNFLILKSKEKEQFYGEVGQKFYASGEKEYENRLQKFKTKLEQVLDTDSEIDSTFKALEKKDLNYFRLDMLLKHQEMYRYFANDSTYTVSKDFLKDVENISLEEEEVYNYSATYQGLVASHYQKEAKKIQDEQGKDYDIAYLNAVGKNSNDYIRNTLLFKAAEFTLTFTFDKTTYYNDFLKYSTNEENNGQITKLYNELQLTAEGQPSPKFIDYENYKGGTSSLDDYKGKHVFIDVWATWCGPCLYEVPFLQEIEKKYHNKNIEFVSISVDAERDHDKWKKMVEEKGMGGVQLYADKSFDSDFAKDYVIKGIPKFILLDPEGKIVRSNAPKPSNKDLITLFNELGI